jgi:hypothetical protein
MATRVEAPGALDFFPTPPWATRALCELLAERWRIKGMAVWEPSCGAGDMAAPLTEYFRYVFTSDVHDYGVGLVHDFLMPFAPTEIPTPVHWVITNPPFRLAEQFIDRAMDMADTGCAMLVRTAFLESVGRYNNLFSVRPPSYVCQFTERVPMVKGRLDATASSATAYCWLVWAHEDTTVAPEFRWIAPCRRRLERPGDYE